MSKAKTNINLNTQKMNTTTIDTDQRIYLLKFAWRLTNGKFITNNLPQAIKQNDHGKGIEFIKTFEPSKNRFVAISRAQILNFHNYDNEGTEILKNHSYFRTFKKK